MEKIYDLNPSSFILLHLNSPQPKLEIGSTIYFDKNGNYTRIPLDKFVKSIDARYITSIEDAGSMIVWQVTGYKNEYLVGRDVPSSRP
jgi:hypothetical protein